MPAFCDVAASIVCDGAPLPEYGIQADLGTRTISCWVASEVGKAFQLNVGNALRDVDLAKHVKFAIYMDDSKSHVHSMVTGMNSSAAIEGITLSSGVAREFKFASLETTDEESAAGAAEKAGWERLGTIEIRVHRVYVLRWGHMQHADMAFAFKSKPVHEKSKKGGSHRISLGDAIPSSAGPYCQVANIDMEDTPYATFLFRYRPRELLQAQGIIPPPIPASVDGAVVSKAASSAVDKGKKRATAPATGSDDSSQKRQRVSEKEEPVKVAGPSEEDEDVKPNVDDLDNDAGSDAELSVIKQQLRTLTKQMEKIEARKRAKVTKGGVKKRVPSAVPDEQSVIDLT